MLVRNMIVGAAAILSGAAAAQQAAKPTDPQIAHIAYTAGQIDIASAELAKLKAAGKDVKAFADDMIRDHKAVNDKALALVKKLGVTPEDNDVSRSLAKQSESKLAELKGLQGKEFDKAYAANEVAYRKQVNAALKDTLIPAAQNAELKGLLQTGLKIFEGHEQHAEMVVKELK